MSINDLTYVMFLSFGLPVTVLLFFFLFPCGLALVCGAVEYRISRRVKDWRLRVPALLLLPALEGGFLFPLIRKNGFLLERMDFFAFDFRQFFVLAALLGTIFGWLLGLWFREE